MKKNMICRLCVLSSALPLPKHVIQTEGGGEESVVQFIDWTASKVQKTADLLRLVGELAQCSWEGSQFAQKMTLFLLHLPFFSGWRGIICHILDHCEALFL